MGVVFVIQEAWVGMIEWRINVNTGIVNSKPIGSGLQILNSELIEVELIG